MSQFEDSRKKNKNRVGQKSLGEEFKKNDKQSLLLTFIKFVKNIRDKHRMWLSLMIEFHVEKYKNLIILSAHFLTK